MSAYCLRPAPALAPRTGLVTPGGPGPRRTPATHATTAPLAAGQPRLALAFERPVDPASSPGAPTPGPAAQQLLQGMLEVLEGRRSPAVLQRSVSADVLNLLVRRTAYRRGTRSATRPVIQRLRVTTPRPGTCELAAVVVLDGRPRAIAAHMTARGDRWVVDDLEVG